MIQAFSKKFWITLISVPVIGTGIILACADGGAPDEYGNSSYTPEAFVDSTYSPFFYSEWWYYYGIGHDTDHEGRFNATNINDWSAYFHNAIPRSELLYLLTEAETTTVDSIYNWRTGKIKTLPLRVHSFQVLKNNKATAFINYLQLAKTCESFAVNNLEYAWEYESKKDKKNQTPTSRLSSALQKGFNNSKDAFLKERYWFQMERFNFFNAPPQAAIDLFDNNEKQFAKNTLYYRTMAYAAGAYYKLKNYSKANYYYSKVYDGCNEMKTVTHYSFHPQEEEDWKTTLSLCTNKNEKITLWQMLGIYYADEKRSIQEIYTLNPRSDKLDLLLTRAINKEENNLNPVYEQPKDSVNKDLLSLVTRIAQAGNTHKPYMWQITAGYLNMLNHNHRRAGSWYAMAEKNLPKEKLLQMQLRLLKLVNTIAAANQATTKLETTVLNDIEWLRTIDNTGYPTFRYTSAYEWIKKTMAAKYQNQKDYIKAVCFNNYTSFYGNDKNVEAMKAFLDKPNKTPYEQLCTKLYIMDKSDLVEYQAILQALKDNLPEAIAKLEGIGRDPELPGNPFNGRLQDCHDCDHAAPQTIKYTRLSLLRKLQDMEEKIKVNEDVHRNALLLGNAFYNITHYGNARAFYECNVMGSYHYSPFTIDSVFRGYLTSMTMATKYYTLALKTAPTDEQKARCHFMLAKCERNQWYNETVYNDNGNEYEGNSQGDFKAWDGFVTLQQQYAHTQYYIEVIKECGYFRTYIKK